LIQKSRVDLLGRPGFFVAIPSIFTFFVVILLNSIDLMEFNIAQLTNVYLCKPNTI
jgi:hypothetical protein